MRIILFVAAALVIYLLGFVPTRLELRNQSAQREKAEHELIGTQVVKTLGSAALDARRGQYEQARQEASTFFTAVRSQIDQGDNSAFTRQQREALEPLIANRDEVITLLARSDPASADKLSDLYAAVRKVLGM
jgi:hypothetical protein